MSETRSFQYALLISIILHSILFIRLPNFHFLPSRRVLDKLEITYFKIKEAPRPQQATRKIDFQAKQLPEIKKEEILEPVKKTGKKTDSQAEKVSIKKEAYIGEKVKKIEAKEVGGDITKKPVYISYYRAVREKIKSSADRKFLKTRNFPEGEVFLSFVVASNGELLELRVVDERSTENLLLKKAAAESVREASPFPVFPLELNQSQITFNVIISFELR